RELAGGMATHGDVVAVEYSRCACFLLHRHITRRDRFIACLPELRGKKSRRASLLEPDPAGRPPDADVGFAVAVVVARDRNVAGRSKLCGRVSRRGSAWQDV